MARIYIGGAGGAPSNNFIRSLREGGRGHYLIGASCVPTDLALAQTDEKRIVPPAASREHREIFLSLLRRCKPDLVHVQNDEEVLAVSRLRDEILAMGISLYLPARETVETCVDKFLTYSAWARAGVPAPRTLLLRSPEDLREAFSTLGSRLWLRATRGAAGNGSLGTDDFEFARRWVDRFEGWGQFTAAEHLTERTVTWLSLWHEGQLVVAQARRRLAWSFGNRAPSGVTGITAVGETCSGPQVDEVAQAAIHAVDARPHGIFGVDLTYDAKGNPLPTEINIGRFFTTHLFFTRAGLNFPQIYVDISLEKRFPTLTRRINPLPDGLLWIRGMDTEPVLTTRDELSRLTGSGDA